MNIRQVADEEAEVTEESMKKAEKALNSVGIVVRDSPSTFRPMFDIISDLGNKWDDLSQVQQAYVSESLAGKRQANVLISTLQNWDMAEKQLNESINANGSALQENEVRMQSWEAKSKQLSANASEFWTNTLNTDTIKNIIDALSGLIDVLDFLVNNPLSKFAIQVGLTTAALYGLGRGIKYITGTAAMGSFLNGLDMLFVTLTKVTTGAMTTSVAIKTLTAAMLKSPLAMIAIGATAIFGIVKAVDAFTTSFEEQQEIIDGLSSKVKELQSEYDNLKSKEDRTKDEEIYLKLLEKELEIKKELLETSTKEQMNEVFLKPKIGGSGTKIANWNVDRLKTLKESLATAKTAGEFASTEKQILSIEENLAETLKTLLNYKNVLGSLPPELEALADAIEYAFNSDEIEKHVSNILDCIDFSDKTDEEFSKINQQLTELFKDIDFDNFEWTKKIEDGLKAIGISAEGLEKVRIYFDKMGKSAKEAKKNNEGLKNSSKDLADSLKDVTSVATDVSKAMQEYNETGRLSQETITDLVTKYPELIDQLKIENGQLVLNKEAVQGLLGARIHSMIQSLEASKNFTITEAENTKTRINNLILEAEAIKGRNAAYNLGIPASSVYPEPSELLKSFPATGGSPYANKFEQIKAEQANAKMAEVSALRAKLNADSAVDDKIASMKALLGSIKTSAYSGNYPSSSKSGGSSGSQDPSSTDKIEQPSYTDPTDAIIAEIQAQSNLTKTKQESIQATIDQAKSEEDYQTALQKTSELIGSLDGTQQLSNLIAERDKINKAKDEMLATSQFGDISRWFDGSNNASDIFTQEFANASEAIKTTMRSEFDAMQKLRNDWLTNKTSMDNIFISQEDLTNLNNALAEINKSKDEMLKESPFGNISRWFDGSNNPSDIFTEEFANASEEVKVAMQAEFDTMQALRKDWVENRSIADHLSISAQQMQDLDTARDKINKIKDALLESSSSQFGDISRWFTGDDNQASVAYVEERNAATAETQKIMEEKFSTMQKLRNAWVYYTDAIKDATEENKKFTKQAKEDTIIFIQNQIKTISDTEVSTLEKNYSNLNIDKWIKDNITATSNWESSLASLQAEIAKIGTPTTLEGQKKYNSLMEQAAKLTWDALQAEKAFQKEIEKARQQALFDSMDASLKQFTDQIENIDHQIDLMKDGKSSLTTDLDLTIVPKIDYETMDEVETRLRAERKESEFTFTPPYSFVEFMNDEFTNVLTTVENNIDDLKQKINDLGEVTPENKEQILGYYRDIQTQIESLTNVAKTAQENLKIKLDEGSISQEEFDQKIQQIRIADLTVLAIPRIEMAAETLQSIEEFKAKVAALPVDVDTKNADTKLIELTEKDYRALLTVNINATIAEQKLIELQMPTSSIHTVHIQTVTSASPQVATTTGFANGTNKFNGGHAVIDDGDGNELIIEPNKQPYMYKEEGSKLVNLPKETVIIPHEESEEMLKKQGIPFFADGLGYLPGMYGTWMSIGGYSGRNRYYPPQWRYVGIDAVYYKVIWSKDSQGYSTYSISDELIIPESRPDYVPTNITSTSTGQNSTPSPSNPPNTNPDTISTPTNNQNDNLGITDLISSKISLFQALINKATENIEILKASIAQYKNPDGTYQDNEKVRETAEKINALLSQQKSAQLAIKALEKERFELQFESYDKTQENYDYVISHHQKVLEYQKLIGSSAKDQIKTEETILEIQQDKLASLNQEMDTAMNILANSQEGTQEWDLAYNKLKSVNSSINDVKNNIIEIAQAIGNSLADNLTKPFEDVVTKNKNNISLIGSLDTSADKQRAYDYTKEIGTTLLEESQEIATRIANIKIQLLDLDAKKSPETVARLKTELENLTNKQYQVKVDIISNIEELARQLSDIDVSKIQKAFDSGKDWQGITPTTLDGQKKYNELLEQTTAKQKQLAKETEEYNKKLAQARLDQILANADDELKHINNVINLVQHQIDLVKDGKSLEVPEIDYNVVPNIPPLTPEQAMANVERPEKEYVAPKTFVDTTYEVFADAVETANNNVEMLKQSIKDLGPITEDNINQYMQLIGQINEVGNGLNTTYTNALAEQKNLLDQGQITVAQYEANIQTINSANIQVLLKPQFQIANDAQYIIDQTAQTMADGITSTLQATIDANTVEILKLDPEADKEKIKGYWSNIATALTEAKENLIERIDEIQELLEDPEVSADQKILYTAVLEKLTVNLASVNSDLEDAKDHIEDNLDTEIKVGADTTQAIEDINKVETGEYSATIIVNADTTLAQNAINALNATNSTVVLAVPSNAKGTKNHYGGVMIKDEEGREAAILPDGTVEIGDNKGAKLANYPAGTQILNHTDTEKLIKLGIPAYADGNLTLEDFLKDYGITDLNDIAKITKPDELIKLKSALHAYLISVASNKITALTTELETYKVDGKYKDDPESIKQINQITNSITTALSAQQASQQALKALSTQGFEAKYEDMDKVLQRDQVDISNAEKLLDYQKSTNASVEEQLETERNILNIKKNDFKLLQIVKSSLLAQKDALKGNEDSQEYKEVVAKLTEVNSMILDVKNSVVQTQDDIDQINFDEATKSFEEFKKAIDDKLDDLDFAEKMLDEDDLDGKLNVFKDKFTTYQDEVVGIQDKIANIDTLFPDLSEKDRTDLLKQWNEELEDAQINVKNTKDFIDQINFDEATKSFEEFKKAIDDKLDDLDFAEKMLDEDDLDGKLNVFKDKFTTYQDEVVGIQDKIANIDTLFPDLSEKDRTDLLKQWNEELEDAQINVKNTKDFIDQINFDKATKSFNDFKKEIDDTLDNLDFAEKMLDEDDSDGKLNVFKDKFTTYQDEVVGIQDKIANIDTLFPDLSEKDRTDLLKQWNEELEDAQINVKNTKDFIDQINFDKATKSFNDFKKEIDDTLDNLDFAEKMLDEDDSDGKLNIAKSKLSTFQDEVVGIQDKIANIDTLFPNLKEEDRIKLLAQWNEELEDAQVNVKNTKDSIDQINFDKATKSLEKFEEKISNIADNLDFASTFIDEDDFDGKIANTTNKIKNELVNIEGLKEKIANIDIFTEGWEASKKAEYAEDLNNQLETAVTNVYNLNNELEKIAVEKISNVVSSLSDEIEKFNDLTNDLQGVLDFQTLFKSGDFEQLNTIYQTMRQNELNTNGFLVSARDSLIAQRDLLEVGSDEWKAINVQVEDYNNKIDNSNNKLATQTKDILKNQFSGQLSEAEKLIFGGQTESEAQEALDDRIALQAKYISGEEKALEIDQLRNTIQTEINNSLSDAEKIKLQTYLEQLDVLESQDKISQDSLDRLQKEFTIEQAQAKLANAQNQKTIQQLTKKEDGSWDFVYVADQDAIDSAKTDLSNAKLDYIKWNRDQENNAEKDALANKSKYFADLKEITDKALNGEYASQEEFNQAISSLNTKYDSELYRSDLIQWNKLFTNLDGTVHKMKSSYSWYTEEMKTLQEKFTTTLSNTTQALDIQATSAKNNSDELFEQLGTTLELVTATDSFKVSIDNMIPSLVTYTQTIQNLVTELKNLANAPSTTPTQTEQVTEVTKEKISYTSPVYTLPIAYAEGGETQSTGLHWLDGKMGKPERVLSAEQTASFNKLVDILPDLANIDFKSIMGSLTNIRNISDVFKPMDFAKNISSVISKSSQSVSQVFNIDKLEFPNVKDGSSVNDFIQGLNSYAIQYSKR